MEVFSFRRVTALYERTPFVHFKQTSAQDKYRSLFDIFLFI